jgi:hypothetical protein
MASPAVSLNKIHLVKKDEALEDIAKHYGHRDWKTIWKAPENRAVVSKRREPKGIAAGDKLVIPPNEKQLKQNASNLASLAQARNGELKVRAALVEEVARREKSVKVYDELIKGFVETLKQVVGTLKENKEGMKKWGEGVDVAAKLAQMGVDLGGLCQTGYKAAKASGEELAKLNKEALKEAVDLTKEPLQDQAIKAAGTLKERDNTAVAFVGIVADSWDKMTSPSFWANTYTQAMPRSMGGEGKSWSEAVTMEVGEDIDNRIKSVIADGAKHIRTLQADQAKVRQRLTETQKLIKECDARAKMFEDQASKLP